MTPKKTPAAVETTTSAQDSAILAEPHTGRKLNPTTTCAGNKPPRRNERRKARERKRWPAKSCYICGKPKGPMCDDIVGIEVAAPTVKRGFVMSRLFSRRGLAHVGPAVGRWATPRGWPHGYTRVINICPPAACDDVASGFESHRGAKSMTQVYPLARPVAPVLSLPGRRAVHTLHLPGRCAAVPTPSASDTHPPEVAALLAQAQTAMAGALALLQSGVTAHAIRLATGRTCRAATLMKRADRAVVLAEGGAA